MNTIPFRQVHLDFHTSELIPDIGTQFDATAFAQQLQAASVNSVTLFAKCHHGWSYYDSAVGARHPNLQFDLLRAQYDACKQAGIAVKIYVTAGWENRSALLYPQWRQVTPDGTLRMSRGRNLVDPGWCEMCFNTPYLDSLCTQVREVVTLFPQADGIFLDIVHQDDCCCTYCRESMQQAGLDWTRASDRRRQAIATRDRYYQATTAAARHLREDMVVFHNTSHLAPGDRSIVPHFSHFELESLPTGGWGYDHFPISAAFARTLDKPYVGMTGKFHTFWGEYGGYKHPNALRYECALMLAFGGGCSVGDQLDPTGAIDPSTYSIIGQAYREVARKEAWCVGVQAVADIALLSPSGHERPGETDWISRQHPVDAGCARLLLESHYLFDVVDRLSDFSPYRLLILPDIIRIDAELAQRLEAYRAAGGKLLLSGQSGLNLEGNAFALDVGAKYQGLSTFNPDYILPVPELRADFVDRPMVMYAPSHRIHATTGRTLGQVFDPHFNRSSAHFCNHMHTPAKPAPSGFDCGVALDDLVYLAHPVFMLYRDKGAVALKQYVARAIDHLLGRRILECNLPSYGRVTWQRQPAHRRDIVHLLCAAPMNRGTINDRPIEVIEDVVAVHDIEIRVRPDIPVFSAMLEPQGIALPLQHEEGAISFTVPRLEVHQMVVLQHAI